jgi:tetratricopeptide (TPR) repeat protein
MNKIKDYYRKITESLPQAGHFTNISLLFLVILLLSSTALAVASYIVLVETKEARHELAQNLNYWQSVAEKHPNSPDVFFKAGYYAARTGDIITAQKYLNEALRLDPSFDAAKALSQQLTADN